MDVWKAVGNITASLFKQMLSFFLDITVSNTIDCLVTLISYPQFPAVTDIQNATKCGTMLSLSIGIQTAPYLQISFVENFMVNSVGLYDCVYRWRWSHVFLFVKVHQNLHINFFRNTIKFTLLEEHVFKTLISLYKVCYSY